jgi:hypothetical protein
MQWRAHFASASKARREKLISRLIRAGLRRNYASFLLDTGNSGVRNVMQCSDEKERPQF